MRRLITAAVAVALVLATGMLLAADTTYVDEIGIYTPAYANRSNTFANTNTFTANQTLSNAGGNSDSYKILLQSHITTGDETQTSSFYNVQGADPYLVISTPNASGAETATVHLKFDLFSFATDNQTDIGASGSNRPKDYFGAGNMTVAGNVLGNTAAYDFIPIEWCNDGVVPPDAAAEVVSGTGKIQARDFGGAAGATVQDVVCPWEVPDNIVAASKIKFKVLAVVTDATGPATKDINFKLSGYSVGDNDPIGDAFGVEVAIGKVDLSAAQYDRVQTVYSAVVTVDDLAAGEVAFLHFERDTANDDDYLKPIGVTGIKIQYQELSAGF